MISNRDISTSPSMDIESSGASSVETSTLIEHGQPASGSEGSGASPEDSLPAFLKLSRAGMTRNDRKNKIFD